MRDTHSSMKINNSCRKLLNAPHRYDCLSSIIIWYTFEQIRIGQQISYTYETFLTHQYIIWYDFHSWHLIHFWADQKWTRVHSFLTYFWYISIWYSFHTMSYTFHTILIWFSITNHYLIHFWVYQDCIKSVSKQGGSNLFCFSQYILNCLIRSKMYQSSFRTMTP